MAVCLGEVKAVLIGKAAPYTRQYSMSAINKQPVLGAISVGHLGLNGDEQGDLKHHGGEHKAIHLYPFEHYANWREELGELTVLQQSGAFGENLSTQGLTEHTICLGDQLRIGTCLLEVSQGRQPCWKLNDRFAVPDMARRLQATFRTGWYCRVLESGVLSAGDTITLVARPYADWTLSSLIELFYHRCLDRDLLLAAYELPLVESWRKLIEHRIRTAQVEDWQKRLEGD